MAKPLAIVIVEDVEPDAVLALLELRRAGIACRAQRVETEADFRQALACSEPDAILSDFSLPAFDGLSALKIARSLCPHTPFIFVSGHLGEERAIEALKQGATDYVLKGNLKRLPSAVRRAVEEAAARAAREKAERDLHESETRFALFLRHLKDYSINLLDTDGRVTTWNTGGERLTGYRENEIRGEHFSRFFLPQDVERGKPAQLLEAAAAQGRVEDEGWRLRKDGSPFWANVVITALRDEEGRLVGFARIVRDMTERKQLLDQVQTSEEKLSSILGELNDVVWSALPDAARITYANAAAERLYGYPAEQLLRDPDLWHKAVHPEDRGRVADFLRELAESGAAAEEYRIIGADGNVRWVLNRARQICDASGRVVRLDGITTDITERKRQEERLVYLANYDALTGLPNRNLLEDRLRQAISHAQRMLRPMAVVFVDLDRFKLVNDTLGHDKGDLLLKIVAEQLTSAVRAGDTVARAGGDEFVIIMTDLAHEGDVTLVVEKLTASLSRPFQIAGHELFVGASIGVALCPKDGDSVHALLRNADTAMFRAKECGKGQYCFYSPDMNARVADRLNLENRLRRAIEGGQFVLHYQPKVDLKTGRIVGLEALLRWNDPEEGLIAPQRFIFILEETGMILDVGLWVIRQALEDLARWRALGPAPPPVAVNVSAVQLRQRDFVRNVTQALGDGGGSATGLGMEITESLIIEDLEGTIGKLRALQERGVGIAIDDFGTGHSSLKYIARLPVDALKIDQSFVAAMAADSNSMAIVSTIISLAHSLDLQVVAEGVETEEQARLLRLLKCDEAQGYLYGPPVSRQEIEEMLGYRH